MLPASAGKTQPTTKMLSVETSAVIGAKPTYLAAPLGGATLGELWGYGDGLSAGESRAVQRWDNGDRTPH
jgi:hypothetical protein